MSAKYTSKIILAVDKINSQGYAPLILQCFISGNRVRISIGERVRPIDFTPDKQVVRIKGKPDLTRVVNGRIEGYLARTKAIFSDHLNTNQDLSCNQFKNLIQKSGPVQDFVAFVEERTLVFVGVKAKGTITNYEKLVKKLNGFQDKISFADLDYTFLIGFDSYLFNSGLSTNSVWGYHKTLKYFINEAIRMKIIQTNPYSQFKVKKQKTYPTFLEKSDVDKLLELYQSGALTRSKTEVLKGFLFMCFTSLRFSDCKAVTLGNVIDGELIFVPKKTKKIKALHRIQLNKPALSLLDLTKEKKDLLFKLPSEPNMNKYLKTIGSAGKISKVLTTHVGRHTFATNFLMFGGDVQTLQQILDHEKIETTMIYVHITKQQPKEQIKLFDDKFAI